jgi:hypothetical protein
MDARSLKDSSKPLRLRLTVCTKYMDLGYLNLIYILRSEREPLHQTTGNFFSVPFCLPHPSLHHFYS